MRRDKWLTDWEKPLSIMNNQIWRSNDLQTAYRIAYVDGNGWIAVVGWRVTSVDSDKTVIKIASRGILDEDIKNWEVTNDKELEYGFLITECHYIGEGLGGYKDPEDSGKYYKS